MANQMPLLRVNMTIYPRPPKPDPRKCRGENCQVLLEPAFLEPVELFGKLAHWSNKWSFESDVCSKCAEELKCLAEMERARRAEKEEKRKEEERSELFKTMVRSRAFEDYTFEKFIHSEQTNEAFVFCRNFNYLSDNLYLWGPAGSGKSHLAVSIARQYYFNHIGTLFIKHAAINRSMQGLKSDEYDEKLNSYVTTPVLVVDDLGTAKRTEFSDQVLYEILDGRWMERKSGMVITSNLSLSDLAVALGDDRLVSRIAGMCQVIKLNAPDWRLKK